ncbi:peroxiredoxin-like family protein [Thalassotalea fonticola]|uniref:thioredoxin-dependent peroxiredoxin n=1 Tax=Thalassotalea fonticola TaxID=3065649 RepID=A0ABZ0GLM9_9GAMM|nr:peroxiredoxin-like family protein [Colwelliaceae bacterium S1-1]
MQKILTFIALLSISLNVLAKPIAETQDLVSPLLPGQSVPSTITTTINNEKVDLVKLIKGKPTVLFFYRGGWCPFCNVQMGQLQAIEGDLKKLGFQLIGISTDSPNDLQKSINNKKLSYQLFSDYNSTVSQTFGLAFYASQEVTDRYLAKMNLQNPLQKNAAGDERLVLPAPAVYVIDAKGLIQFQYVNPNYKTRLAPELLLHAAKLAK